MHKRVLLALLLLFVPLLGHGQIASPILQPHQTFVDSSGSPCAGCSLYSYAAGTTTPLATYTDTSATSQNTNPVVLDAAGGANIWVGPTAYKFILKDTLGTILWTVDQVNGTGPTNFALQQGTGPVNGSNTTFTFVSAPSPTPTIMVFAGGVFQQPTVDFTLSYNSGQQWKLIFNKAPNNAPVLILVGTSFLSTSANQMSRTGDDNTCWGSIGGIQNWFPCTIGSGNVFSDGTAATGQYALWSDSQHIEGQTGIPYSDLTGSAPTFNQSTTGNAATATKMNTDGTPNQVWAMDSGGAAQGWHNSTATGNPGQYTGVSFSATPTFTASSSTVNSFGITLTANVTSSTLANSAAGQYIAFKICQDATGGRTFTWPSGFSNAIAIYPAASACTLEQFFWDGTNAQPVAPAQITGGSLNALWFGSTGAAPATPSAGNLAAWFDSTDNALKVKNSSGTITAAVGFAACTNQVLTAISDQAPPTCATVTTAMIGTLASGSNGLAASATTDATNASNISSGNLGAARLPSGILSCSEAWSGSGTSSALVSGDDAISNNSCYNDSGATRTITAVKARSSAGSNTTTVTPTFGSAGTGTSICSGALTAGSSYAYSSTCTVSNASWTTGTGIDPGMGGTLTGSSIVLLIEYHY